MEQEQGEDQREYAAQPADTATVATQPADEPTDARAAVDQLLREFFLNRKSQIENRKSGDDDGTFDIQACAAFPGIHPKLLDTADIVREAAIASGTGPRAIAGEGGNVAVQVGPHRCESTDGTSKEKEWKSANWEKVTWRSRPSA